MKKLHSCFLIFSSFLSNSVAIHFCNFLSCTLIKLLDFYEENIQISGLYLYCDLIIPSREFLFVLSLNNLMFLIIHKSFDLLFNKFCLHDFQRKVYYQQANLKSLSLVAIHFCNFLSCTLIKLLDFYEENIQISGLYLYCDLIIPSREFLFVLSLNNLMFLIIHKSFDLLFNKFCLHDFQRKVCYQQANLKSLSLYYF